MTLICTMLSLSVSASQDTEPTAGTDVWLSVVPRPSQERISVTLPTVIAFVVNGTADETGGEAVTVQDGNLLLPNVKVEGANGNAYQLVTTGEPTLVVKNYSTNVPQANMDDENPPRRGVQVALGATVSTAKDENGDTVAPEDRGNWMLTETAPTTKASDVKMYRLSLDGHAFSKRVNQNTFEMEGEIVVGAPPASEFGWTAGGMSNEPFEQEIVLGVEVGGTRDMYDTTENSVKAAQVVWSVRALPLQE